MNLNRRDLALFILGVAVGMFFILTWASRTILHPMYASYLVAQGTAALTLGAGLWLLFKK